MARNRQRRAQGSRNPGPQPTEPHRENVPGELDHASGDAEEFEADLIAGADAAPDVDTSDTELERAATEEVGDLDDDGDVDADDRALARSGGGVHARHRTQEHTGRRALA